MLGAGLQAVLNLLGAERRVLIVGPLPEFRHAAPDCALRAKLYSWTRDSCAMSRRDVDARGHESMQVLQALAEKRPGTVLIDPTDVFCDHATCWPFGPAGLFYVDDNHAAPLGAEMIYRHFQGAFRWVFGAGPAP